MSNPQQYWNKFSKKIFDKLNKGRNLLITGPAGTGKSTFISYFEDLCNDNSLNVGIVAPTGVAALNIGGKTLHSFLGLGICSNVADYVERKQGLPRKDQLAQIKRMDVLIVDEVSMVSRETLDLISHVLKKIKKSTEHFGGVKIILIGDFYQLPPVRTNNQVNVFPFQTQLWLDANFSVVLLDKIFRQDEPRFLTLLNNVRVGEVSDDDINLLHKISLRIPPEEVTRIATTNKVVNKYNNQGLSKLKTPPYTFTSSTKGTDERLLKQLSSGVLAPEELVVKEGARVMNLVNNPKLGIYNGQVGTVQQVVQGTNPSILINFDDGKIIRLGKHTWEHSTFKKGVVQKTVSLTQFPLKLAYAITVHKSQGMTLDKALIDAEIIFEPGLFYVAISRVKTLRGLFIKNFNPTQISTSKTIGQFYDFYEKQKVGK